MARFGDEYIMQSRDFGTCPFPVQKNLRFDIDKELANMICCRNREYAEEKDYFVPFLDKHEEEMSHFYDSVTGKLLFSLKRSWSEFIEESKEHGWPSFRDEDVNWDNVRILEETGETVSTDGTHLGHCIPDDIGNRYCINLVCISGTESQ